MAIGPDRKTMTHTQVRTAEIDVGLRSYMLRVYNYMALGVAFTGAIAMIIATNVALVQSVASYFWVFFIGILGLGWFAPRIMISKSVGAAQLCFWAYAALWGAVIGPTLYVYGQIDPMLVPKAFFITAAAFAGMSLYGYTTKRNLGPIGAFLCMATFGILIALLLNVFLIQSAGFDLLLSIIVVLVFSGLTAYETQMIKNLYYEADDGDVATRKAIFGAFLLYGSFVTLFVWILHLLGMMRD
jgi:FtsH-binding integral membrane protein